MLKYCSKLDKNKNATQNSLISTQSVSKGHMHVYLLKYYDFLRFQLKQANPRLPDSPLRMFSANLS